MVPTTSSICSDTDSDNAVLCSPLIECRASQSPSCQSPTHRAHPACSPTHRGHPACSPTHRIVKCHPNRQHDIVMYRNRADEVRLGCQEAEDSGLEDTVGSAENLSNLGCSQCHMNVPVSEVPRQSLSSPDINFSSSGSLNKLQQCRLQHSLKRISIDGQQGRKRIRKPHFASIHKPSASSYFDKSKYKHFAGESQSPRSPTDLDKEESLQRNELGTTESVSDDIRNAPESQVADRQNAPHSPFRESEV